MATCRNCDLPTSGKSSYCVSHKREAREAWKAKIADDAVARENRRAEYAELWERACREACEAWRNAVPQAMVVSNDRTGERWHVSEGVCGFASLVIKPANSSFAYWLKNNVRTSKHYQGGLSVWSSVIVPEDATSQSYDRKVAAMRAAARVLSEAGIRAYSSARLD